jgi:hypothetical protein
MAQCSTSSTTVGSTVQLEELLLPPLIKSHNRAVMEAFFFGLLMSLVMFLDISLRAFIFCN